MSKNVKLLTISAMLTAIAIILGVFKISLTPALEIRFAQIPIALAGGLFGIVPGVIVGILADIGGYFVRPTGMFFPGFTVTAAMNGLIYGLLVYKRGITLPRIIIVEICRTILVGMLLHTFFLSILLETPFQILFIGRIWKELLMIPVNITLLYILFNAMKKAKLGYEL